MDSLAHERLAALVAEIGHFHVTQPRLRREQDAIEELLARGEAPSAERAARYVAAVRAYFEGFDREARRHLRDVDRRLGKIAQLQYNLTAERGVAAGRVEATQGVLSRLQELAPQ